MRAPVVERLRILVIDDDPVLLETLTEALGSDGHRVTGGERGGLAGIAASSRGPGEAAPSTWSSPTSACREIDGRQVAAGIKEMAPATRRSCC